MIIIYLYLAICLMIALYLIGAFAAEDIGRLIAPQNYWNEKFGPNYKNPLSWAMLALMAIPVVNLVVLALYIDMSIKHARSI